MLLLAAIIPRVVDAFQSWSPDYEVAIGRASSSTLPRLLYVAAFPHYAPWNPTWLPARRPRLYLPPDDRAASVWLVDLVIVYVWARGRLRNAVARYDLHDAPRRRDRRRRHDDPHRHRAGAASAGAGVRAHSRARFLLLRPERGHARPLAGRGVAGAGRLGPQWLAPLVLPVALILVRRAAGGGGPLAHLPENGHGDPPPLFVVLNLILEVLIAMISWIAYLFYLLLSTLVNRVTGGRCDRIATVTRRPDQHPRVGEP